MQIETQLKMVSYLSANDHKNYLTEKQVFMKVIQIYTLLCLDFNFKASRICVNSFQKRRYFFAVCRIYIYTREPDTSPWNNTVMFPGQCGSRKTESISSEKNHNRSHWKETLERWTWYLSHDVPFIAALCYMSPSELVREEDV